MRKQIDEDIKKSYEEIFGLVMVQHINWVPTIICNSCRVMLNRWKKDKNIDFIKFSIPAKWNEPYNEKDCYFCSNEISGFTSKTKNKIIYTTVMSLTPPISVDRNKQKINETSVNVEMMGIDEYSCDEENTHRDDDSESDSDYSPSKKNSAPSLITQSELSDVIRNLGLPKDGAEYLASFLKKKHLLASGTKISLYRNRDLLFRQFFTTEDDLVFCTNVQGLINELKTNSYRAGDWRLFIDSSKRSIKAVLLHNTNIYAPVPIAHSTVMQENYNNMQVLLKKIDYKNHQWQICGDLKIISMLLGQQSGFTKYPCCLCLWDSRDRQKHYKVKEWPVRTTYVPGSCNIIHDSLVDPSKILIPPLHIKLGLMKQFVKALDKNGKCFQYLQTKFPKLSEAKIKEGVFDGPQIRKMFKDSDFTNHMNKLEKAAWLSFRSVVRNFLGNRKSPEYRDIVAGLIKDYEKLGCLMNLKLHFLDSHIDEFPNNLGHFSEEQGERFHQDLKVMETRYQGRWDVNMLADFCWMLKRETQNNKKCKRNPLHRSFEEKRTRYSSKKENS